MKKWVIGVLSGVLMVALSVGLRLMWERVMWERAHQSVSVAISLKDALRLTNFSGEQDRVGALKSFRQQSGLTTIILDEDTLEGLSASGQISILTGGQILGMQRVGARMGVDPKVGCVYVWAQDSRLLSRISEFLSLELGILNVRTKVPGQILEVAGDWDDIKVLGLGVDSLSAVLLRAQGWGVVFRFHNGYTDSTNLLTQKLDLVGLRGSVVLFDGMSVLGAPKGVKQLADALRDRGLRYGDIEFAQQNGSAQLVYAYPEGFVRVHSIPDAEFLKLSPGRAISRYIRAVRERSTRIVVVHPVWMEANSQGVLAHNIRYIRSLVAQFKLKGLQLVKTPLSTTLSERPFLDGVALALGVWVGMMILWHRLIGFSRSSAWVLTLKGVGLVCLTLYGGLLRDVVVALAAIIFPLLCVTEWKDWHWSLLRGFGWLILGIILVSGLCSTPEFWTGAFGFVGVKGVEILSIWGVLLIVYFNRDQIRYLGANAGYYFCRPITWAVMVGLIILGFSMLIYIWRSGNGAVVSESEYAFRAGLEGLLGVRPRSKELLAFTLFSVGIWQANRCSPGMQKFFAVAGGLGVVSIMNSFCHFHTPLVISGVRSMLGLGIGILWGGVGILLWKSIKKLWIWIANY